MLTLYFKPSCPFCQKVLVAAEEMGVGLNQKDILSDDSLRDELIEKGGKKQVPYLEDPEMGEAMYESDDIIAYLKENYADTPGKDSGESPNVCIACEG